MAIGLKRKRRRKKQKSSKVSLTRTVTEVTGWCHYFHIVNTGVKTAWDGFPWFALVLSYKYNILAAVESSCLTHPGLASSHSLSVAFCVFMALWSQSWNFPLH